MFGGTKKIVYQQLKLTFVVYKGCKNNSMTEQKIKYFWQSSLKIINLHKKHENHKTKKCVSTKIINLGSNIFVMQNRCKAVTFEFGFIAAYDLLQMHCKN